jgi:hypothetical protein
MCRLPVSRSLIYIKISQGDVDDPQKFVYPNKVAVKDCEHDLCHIALFWDLSAVQKHKMETAS